MGKLTRGILKNGMPTGMSIFYSEMPCGFLGLVSVPPNTLQILWEVFTSVEKNEECNLLNMVTVMISGSSILKGLYFYP
jgi:hypothetical protein